MYFDIRYNICATIACQNQIVEASLEPILRFLHTPAGNSDTAKFS